MSTVSVNSLLDVVGQVQIKYDEINRITGRNYNVFDILGLSTNEVRLHSSFIAQLLSPSGKHGQGAVYLELFLNLLNDKIKSDENSNTQLSLVLDVKTTKVFVEMHVGKQTEEEGGRLDIICQDRDNHCLIIENKIHAPDQENQLLRYHNFDKNATLVYLNLFGDEPSQSSVGNKDHAELNLVLMSYETDITRWLELCLKESYHLPVIRETIFQYLNTIKKITNQIEIKEMDNEIVNLLIVNREKISSALLIEKSVKDAKKALLRKFGDELTSALEQKYAGTARTEMSKDFGDRYAGIRVYPQITTQVFFLISFLSDYRDMYLEVYNFDNIENGVVKKIKNETNLSFYKEKLNAVCKHLGQIQNVNSAWQGDWVCRYAKLDGYFSSDNGWGDLADKNYEIVNTVMNEISPVIDAMLVRVKAVFIKA